MKRKPIAISIILIMILIIAPYLSVAGTDIIKNIDNNLIVSLDDSDNIKPIWVRKYRDPDHTVHYGRKAAIDGDYIYTIANCFPKEEYYSDALLLKYNTKGILLGSHIIEGIDYYNPSDLVIYNDKIYIINQYAEAIDPPITKSGIMLSIYDMDCNLVTKKIYLMRSDECPYTLFEMAVLNGYLYAVGFMGCTNIDLPALLKFNAEGDLVKKKIFDFDGRGSSIISYNDHIYITGTKESKTNFLYKIDEDCKKISESYYLGNSGSCDEIIVHNGNIFVVFEESHTDPYNEKYSSEIFLQKFDLNCNPLWDVAKKIAVSPYLDSYLNLPEGIAANGDYIYFCGSILDMSNLPFYKVDVFLVKYNVALEKEDWVKIWDNDKEDLASDLVMDNEGYLYVTGSTGNEVLNGRTSIFLLKCDRNGEGEFKERTIENKKLLNRWLQNMVGKWDFPLLQRLLNQLSKPR